MRIGLATYQKQKTMTDDDKHFFPYLEKMGLTMVPFDWKCEALHRDLDVVITRSCWDFGSHVNDFVKWLDKLQTFEGMVLNSPDLLRWNHSKKYLIELANRGAKMPKTTLIPVGTRVNKEIIHEMTRGFAGIVLKPAISVNGFDTYKFATTDLDQIVDQTNTLLQSRDALIQEYIPEIQTNGEISFLFFGGEYSHAVKKVPKQGEFRIQEEHGGRRELYHPTSHLLDQATTFFNYISRKTLFARVDCIERDGQLLLIELELIHPMFFLKYDRFAAQRFASAVAAAVCTDVATSA